MIKIYYQTNNNDCGIAVTQTLINYFYKRETTKEELYQYANIKEDGLSILDLEILNEKHGIKLESYSMSFDEFVAYETNEVFLLVINRNNEQHYTLAKKKGKKVILYDPSLGKVKLSIEEVKNLWLDIFISVSLIEQPKEVQEFKLIKDKPDTYKITILFLVNITVLFFSILNTYLLRYSVNHIFNNFDYANLIKVLVLNIICFAIFQVGEFLESCLVFQHTHQYFTNLYERLLNSLKNKKNSYFQKLGKNQFLIFKEHINCISSYHAEYINKWYISVFTIAIVSLLLICINPFFIFLIIASALIQFFFWKLTKDSYYRYFPRLNEIQNNGKRILYSLESFLNRELNISKLSSLVQTYKNNWQEEIVNQEELFFKSNLYSKLNTYLNNLCYIVVFALVAFYILVGNMNFGHLMMMNLLQMHLNKSFNSLIGYYGFKVKYDYSKQIYSQLLNVDSFKEETDLMPRVPERIFVKNLFYAAKERIIFDNLNLEIKPFTIICGPSGIGKSILYKLIIKKLNPSLPAIYFDNEEVSNIPSSVLRDLCIYQISDGYIDPQDLRVNLSSLCPELEEELKEICELMNLDLNQVIISPDQLSSGQKQLINILSLLKYKNKILLLDEIASHINLEARILIYKIVIPYLASSNFVVCSEHAPEIVHYFPNRINLCFQ